MGGFTRIVSEVLGCFLKRKNIGDFGENISCKFLREIGFKIITRNWRYGHGEIDIIAEDHGVLVFVEVRLRKKGALVSGYDSISTHKKLTLCRACVAFLQKYAYDMATYRFDVIDVEHDYSMGTDKINHFINVPLF